MPKVGCVSCNWIACAMRRSAGCEVDRTDHAATPSSCAQHAVRSRDETVDSRARRIPRDKTRRRWGGSSHTGWSTTGNMDRTSVASRASRLWRNLRQREVSSRSPHEASTRTLRTLEGTLESRLLEWVTSRYRSFCCQTFRRWSMALGVCRAEHQHIVERPRSGLGAPRREWARRRAAPSRAEQAATRSGLRLR
jgi:hypothetical protein